MSDSASAAAAPASPVRVASSSTTSSPELMGMRPPPNTPLREMGSFINPFLTPARSSSPSSVGLGDLYVTPVAHGTPREAPGAPLHPSTVKTEEDRLTGVTRRLFQEPQLVRSASVPVTHTPPDKTNERALAILKVHVLECFPEFTPDEIDTFDKKVMLPPCLINNDFTLFHVFYSINNQSNATKSFVTSKKLVPVLYAHKDAQQRADDRRLRDLMREFSAIGVFTHASECDRLMSVQKNNNPQFEQGISRFACPCGALEVRMYRHDHEE